MTLEYNLMKIIHLLK